MLSIFVIYSVDRLEQFEIFYECLQEMPGYEECQKILIVDGEETNVYPEDFEIFFCKRPNKYFSWATAWNLGIEKSIYEKIWYLDSDRILPIHYLQTLQRQIKDNTFTYSSQIVGMKQHCSLDFIKECRQNPYLHWGSYRQDYRIPCPPNTEFLSMGKNPMSGNTGFTKTSYYKSGGLSFEFEGPALADTDYFYKTYLNGFNFETIQCLELHLKHDYAIDVEERYNIYYYNALKVCKKYNLKPCVDLQEEMNKASINFDIGEYTIDEFLEKCKINKIKSL